MSHDHHITTRQSGLFDGIDCKPLSPEEKVKYKEMQKRRSERAFLNAIKEQSEKLEIWLKKGMSIDRQKTFSEKHYWVEDLSYGSGKEVWAICKQCGKGYWLRYLYYHDLCMSCSHSGEKNHMFGKHHSEETCQKISESHTGLHVGEKNHMFGRTGKNSTCYGRTGKKHPLYGTHPSEETRIKQSCTMRGITVEQFNGFLTEEHALFRVSKDYADWRDAVFERDEYTCQECGARGGGIYLESHHNVPFHLHPEPEFSLNVDNGVTLCRECHAKTKGHEDEYYAKYNAIIKSNSGFKGDFLESSAILEAMTKENDPMPQRSLDYEFMPPEQIKEIERRKKIDDFANSILDKCKTYSSPNLRPSNPHLSRQPTIFDY